ncbi:putative RING-H2 finger protein ATL21A [Papaver somniferum]|uniref:putative RING-H2 finger protein ATL21A n=1 Tax=Papaver somniferum TaxID=3469 RepID=UPI000E701F3E|nr:putative RING-H2 finger protein ATL21A [Papaver somniferum]
MSLLHFIIPYIILFFFSLTKISCQETCSSIQCDVDQPKISFPFGIKELQKDKQCGYPGFNLECNYYTKETLLKLPSTLGKLYVKDINYTKKEIRLYGGTYGCLPQRYMESGGIDISPFRGFASHTYRFYDCPLSIKSDSTASETLAFYAFAATCITAFWDAFVTPYSSTDPTQVRVNQFLIDYGCLLKASVSVPIPSRIVSNDSSLSKKQNVSIYSYNLVTDDLYLTWTDPPKNGNLCSTIFYRNEQPEIEL